MNRLVVDKLTKFAIIRCVTRFLKKYLNMNNSHDVFDPIIPWQCVPEMLSIIKTQDFSRANTGAMLQHGGYFIGCIGKLVQGEQEVEPEPDNHNWLFGAPQGMQGKAPSIKLQIAQATDAQLEAKLQELCDQATLNSAPKGFDWTSLLKIVGPIVLELLNRWLNKAVPA